MRTIGRELRVQKGDFYTIARFKHNSNRKIFDMVGDQKLTLDLNELAVKAKKNPKNMERIIALYYFTLFNNERIFKPIHSNDDNYKEREYAPFQFLARYLQSKGYAGIKYRSTVHQGGTNVVIFNSHDIEIIKGSIEKIIL